MNSCLTEQLSGVQEGPAHVEAFLAVLRNVTKEDTVQYVLAVLDDMLTRALAHRSSCAYAPSPVCRSALPDFRKGTLHGALLCCNCGHGCSFWVLLQRLS